MAKRSDEDSASRTSDHQEVEEALREAEWKFRALFEHGPIGVAYHRVIYDDHGKPVDYYFIDANSRYIELTGVDPRGKLVTEAFPGIENDPFDWIGTFGRVGMTGESVRFQQYLELNDRWYDLVGYQYKPDHFVGAFLEITEHMRTLEQLRRSEARYRTLFEKTSNAIVVVDKKTGHIVDANAAALVMTGRSRDDLVDTHVSMAGDENAAAPLAAATQANKAVNHGRVVYRRPDGTSREALLTTVPVDDDFLFGIAHDITDELELEARFRQAQKMEAVGHLAGGVAHDFNNILVPIIGYAELALEKLTAGDELHAQVTQIRESAERAADLTRQILAYSRQQVLEMRLLDLGQVVAGLRPMIARLIPENIELNISARGASTQVMGDRAQLEQIIMNLVVNAGDAMPDGGQLSIETRVEYLDADYFATDASEPRPGDYVQLTVRDTGHGMDAETLSHIFEPFFTTKEVDKGTGLGLATVFGIVKQHDGYIWVDSEPGQGTTVTVHLPLNETNDQAESRVDVEPASLRGTETILVVEDEDVVRTLVCATLETYGYRVLEAAGPIEGLDLASRYADEIHLLLSDVIMPDLNGRELFEKLAASRPDLEVLYMSGYSGSVIAKHGILHQDLNFIQKPFSIENLARKVKQILG